MQYSAVTADLCQCQYHKHQQESTKDSYMGSQVYKTKMYNNSLIKGSFDQW